MIRLSAFRFFIENAGYCTPPGAAVCALALAKAEQWANDNGVEFRIDNDPDADPSFVETWTPKEQEQWNKVYHYCYSIICFKPCPDHGWDCKHREVLASLSGIFDPTDAYLRVVRAELALEAVPSEVKA